MPVRPPYTVGLWFATNPVSGVETGPGPPAGFEWIVRNVDIFVPLPRFTGQGGWILSSVATPYLVGWGGAQLEGGCGYSWEGRQAVGAGDELQVSTDQPGFKWAITGYQLAVT